MDAPRRKYILVVEPDSDLRRLIENTLNSIPQYRALAVPDAREASVALGLVRFNLVVIDSGSPDLASLQFPTSASSYDCIPVLSFPRSLNPGKKPSLSHARSTYTAQSGWDSLLLNIEEVLFSR